MKERTSFDNLEGVLQRGRRGVSMGGVRGKIERGKEEIMFSTLSGKNPLVLNVKLFVE